MAEEKAKGPKEGKAPAPKGDKGDKGEKKAKGAAGAEQAKTDKKSKGAAAPKTAVPKGYKSRLLEKYRQDIVPGLVKKYNYGSVMEVPRLLKIVVNMGVGEATKNIKELDEAEAELALICGQKPKVTRSMRSVAAFKVRKGMPVGCCVTLRGWRMYDFLDRLINVAIPRIRDFRGLPGNAFDGRGNYSMGVREQLIFTEIDYNKVTQTRGMNITAVTTAKSDEECKDLLAMFGMPFRKN